MVVDVPGAAAGACQPGDNNSEEQIRRIMAAQMDREQRLALADIVIDNAKSLAELDDSGRNCTKEFLLRAERRRLAQPGGLAR